MKKEFFTALLLISCSLFSVSASAEDQPPIPPQNRLGQEVGNNPLEVVYPRPEEIVEDTLSEIEDLQLTPEQYNRLKKIYIDRERQRATPYAQPPKPITRTMQVNLDPGVSPPVLRLTRGQQTSIVFSDYNG